MELVGRQFGHIRVTEVVGEGGMGAVYAGHDEKLDRKVALKVLHADQRLDREARERLLREARALSKVEHPNISRIYDYIETSDVDLLVLEYIDGQTLQEAIDAGLPTAEKLRIALTIAEVLVRAHRAGVVHRDLKPENVMLTNDGAVKVLDFGLARWFQKSHHSSEHAAASDDGPVGKTAVMRSVGGSDVSPSGGRAFLATAAGITLGTPLFMSPEQARGESLTPASDMFSFGLLLQVLFTGEEPHPDNLNAREVILRVARGETDPLSGAPKNITAFINSFKQFAPADRPTAVQAVEKLRFLIDTPQRMMRRLGAAAAVALMLLVGWRYTVDLKAERAIAVRARADAEDLIEFMLGDLRKKLEPIGSLEVLDDVGERALAYIGSHDPETMSNDTLARASKALNQIGEVRIGQGKLTEALGLFKRSLGLAELAVKREPDSAPAQLAVATAHFWIGEVNRLRGSLPNALRHFTSYMTITERLAKDHPANEEYQLERAYGHSNVASIHELQGDFSRALQHLLLTRQIKQGLYANKPADVNAQADLARTSNRIGFVLERSGDLAGAREHYQSEFATYARLAAADPKNRRWQDRLVVSHNYLSRVFELTGELDRALELRRAERALIAELVHRDPANVTWRRNLALTQMKYADTLRMKGEVTPALAAMREAEGTMQNLLARSETVASWRRDLGNIRTAQARVHLANEDPAAAERAAQSAVELLLPFSSEALAPRFIADAWLTLGDAREASGEQAGATEAWTQAARILGPMALDSRSPEALDIMARTLLRLDRRDEAAPLVTRLQSNGYRAPDFVRTRW